ncbi:MAG: hypothetical protein OEL79_01520, partial [Chromatiales bacterium]|nr:hypothetical protein [Chromatiales bacterium]
VSKENYIWAITESKGKTDSDFYTPYIVNASFCLEILLKSIIYYEKDEWVHGHNLVNLYSKISTNVKKEINDSFKRNHKANTIYKEALKVIKHEASISITWNVASLLDRASNAFENWRYAFDKNKQKSCFIGYDELYKVLTEAKEKIVLTRHSS